MSQRKTYNVNQNQNGDWQVKARGAQRASAVEPKKSDAVAEAKRLAKAAALGQIVIQGRNGKIQTEHTYGKDPRRSPG